MHSGSTATTNVSSHTFASSMIMKEINSIKNDLQSLKASVSSLQSRYPSDLALRDEIALLRQSLNTAHNHNTF